MAVAKPPLDGAPAGPWGPFVLGRRIGRGGMGSVHAALRRGTFGIAQVVALKTMTSGIADDPAAREAFLREARILARLAHPNVVRWLDAGEVGDDVYIAMELLHGASLAALLAASPEPPPVPIALAILLDLARGLHASHELCDEAGEPLGLVHQDVSPHNVIVGYDGRTRLVDFGVARLASVDASRTDTVRGKPAYLAPEQLEGRRLDRRADVFALGVVAFELLTGRRLFARGSIAETHTAVLFDPIPDLATMRAEALGARGSEGIALPPGIAAAVARALARPRDERWPTADALRRALLLARDEAGLPDPEDLEIGAFVHGRAPPPWTPEQLFAEIRGALAPGDAAATEETWQAATQAPRRGQAPPDTLDAQDLSQAATQAPRRGQAPGSGPSSVPTASEPRRNPVAQVVGPGPTSPAESPPPPAEPPGTALPVRVVDSSYSGVPRARFRDPAGAPEAGRAPASVPRRTPVWLWLGVPALAALGVLVVLGERHQPRVPVPEDSPVVPASAPAPPETGEGGSPPGIAAPSATEPAPTGSQGVPSPRVSGKRAEPAQGAFDSPSSAPPGGTTVASARTVFDPLLPASSRTASTAAAAPESGWISVWSTPWGRVRIDGRPVGDSPVVRVVVPPGPHTVTVKSDAGEQSKGVVVKVGEESRVRFVF